MREYSEIVESTYVLSLCPMDSIQHTLMPDSMMDVIEKDSSVHTVVASPIGQKVIPVNQRVQELGKPSVELGPSTVVLPVVGTPGTSSNSGSMTTQQILYKLRNAIDSTYMSVAYNLEINQIINDSAQNKASINIQKNRITSLTDVVDNHHVAITENASQIGWNTNGISDLHDEINNINSNVEYLNNEVGSTHSDITDLEDTVDTLSASTSSLGSTVSAHTQTINSHATAIASLDSRMSDFDGALDPILQVCQQNANDLEAHQTAIDTNVATGQNNSAAINSLRNELHGGSIGLNREQEGFAKNGDTVVLLRKWLTTLPSVNVMLGYGTTYDPSSTASQELIFGMSGLKETTNVGEYEFTVCGALLEESTPVSVALAYTEAGSALAPVGTETIFTESAETTTTNDCMGIHVIGSIGLSNDTSVNTGGRLILEACIDSGDWFELSRIEVFFTGIDGVVSQKNIDVLLVYPQVAHTYKFRAVLVNTYSSDATCKIDGQVSIDTVLEVGAGAEVSTNQSFKWIAKG